MMNKRFNFVVLLALTLAQFVWHAETANAAPLSDEAFIELVRNGTPQEVEAAIRAGANANAKNIRYTTALMTAAMTDNHEVVAMLLANGADVNVRNASVKRQ